MQSELFLRYMVRVMKPVNQGLCREENMVGWGCVAARDYTLWTWKIL